MNTVQHHTKYKEIHGYDEIIMMDRSEHQKLHIKLRHENKCNISVDKLHQISVAAYRRSVESRLDKQEFEFNETMCRNIRLRERVRYNPNSGAVTIWLNFVVNNRGN